MNDQTIKYTRINLMKGSISSYFDIFQNTYNLEWTKKYLKESKTIKVNFYLNILIF